jgi:hypothetical protein
VQVLALQVELELLLQLLLERQERQERLQPLQERLRRKHQSHNLMMNHSCCMMTQQHRNRRHMMNHSCCRMKEQLRSKMEPQHSKSALACSASPLRFCTLLVCILLACSTCGPLLRCLRTALLPMSKSDRTFS